MLPIVHGGGLDPQHSSVPDDDMRTLNIATTTHGRVLVREAADPVAVIVSFHGYMENAEIPMERKVVRKG